MNNVKVISGKFRGRNLKTPNSSLTHPMGSREKLALFNMISEFLPGAIVLDAYSGSGALGIEAISRGASEVWFIEKSAKVGEVIRDNLATLGISGEVFIGEVMKFTSDTDFRVILADPPYDNFKLKEVEYLAQFLDDDGVFVLSHPGEAPEVNGLRLLTSRRYAAASISVYVK